MRGFVPQSLCLMASARAQESLEPRVSYGLSLCALRKSPPESEQQELLCTEIIIPCILHYSSLKVC